MEKEFVSTFCTPTINVVTRYPDSSTLQQRDTPIFVCFDQKIDPKVISNILCFNVHTMNSQVLNIIFQSQEVLKCITVTNSRWGSACELQLLNDSDIDNPLLKELIRRDCEGCWLAIQATSLFDFNSDVQVKIGPKVLFLLYKHLTHYSINIITCLLGRSHQQRVH